MRFRGCPPGSDASDVLAGPRRAVVQTGPPPPPRWVRAGAVLAVLGMLLLSGTHWVALQTVAFGSMLVRYAQDRPVREAVAMTFDGEHPCPLCHAVQEGRQQDEQQPQAAPGWQSRLEASLPDGDSPLPGWNPPATPCPGAAPASGPSRTDAPPKPRPRSG